MLCSILGLFLSPKSGRRPWPRIWWVWFLQRFGPGMTGTTNNLKIMDRARSQGWFGNSRCWNYSLQFWILINVFLDFLFLYPFVISTPVRLVRCGGMERLESAYHCSNTRGCLSEVLAWHSRTSTAAICQIGSTALAGWWSDLNFSSG